MLLYFHTECFPSGANAATLTVLKQIVIVEPRREKTGLRGFRPGLTQTDLYKHRKELEA